MTERIYRYVSLALFAITTAATGAAFQDKTAPNAAKPPEEQTIYVGRLTIAGAKAFSAGQIESVLATQPSSRLPWRKKHAFDRRAFEDDLKRIAAFYADHGYPDARVTSFDVKLNKPQNKVDLAININEGEPIVVTAIDFEGFQVIPPKHLSDLRGRMPLQVGQPLDRQALLTSREMALNEVRDHGYPYSRVVYQDDSAGGPRRRRITFTAQPGVMAYFGDVAVQGNSSVSDQVITRQLLYRPGDLFRRSLVQESQRRLYELQLFQFANITVNREQQQTQVPTHVTVTEGKHRHVTFGVGYGTEEKARADVQWSHVNFFGGARTATIHGRWSSLDRGVRAEFTQPYLFAPHFALNADAQNWYAYEPAYQVRSSGGRVTLTHRANHETSTSLTFTNEYDSSRISNEALNDLSLRNQLIELGLNPMTGVQNGTLSSVALNFTHTTAENILNPQHGYYVSLQGEEAGKLLPGRFHFEAVTAEGRHYLPVGKNIVIANRVRVGSIKPRGNLGDEVPFSRRFFLGGATSIRGWGRYEVAPLSGSGLPLGGFSLFETSSEVRMHLFGPLGGVAFLDTGNVWADSWSVRLSELRYAVGPGLRYNTPVGPIRVDVGYQLNPIPGLLINGRPQTRRWRIHFSIGQAF